MRISKFTLATALGASLTLGAAAFAAVPMNAQDKTFVTKAAQGGMAEVAAGKLAASQGSAAAVKAFGQRMVGDHGKADRQLMEIAKQQGIALPSSVDPMDASMQSKLETLHGAAFDTAYLKGQETAHEQTAALMQAEISGGKDPQLVDFAKQTLPTVEMHLSMDKSDLAKMGGGSMKSSSM